MNEKSELAKGESAPQLTHGGRQRLRRHLAAALVLLPATVVGWAVAQFLPCLEPTAKLAASGRADQKSRQHSPCDSCVAMPGFLTAPTADKPIDLTAKRDCPEPPAAPAIETPWFDVDRPAQVAYTVADGQAAPRRQPQETRPRQPPSDPSVTEILPPIAENRTDEPNRLDRRNSEPKGTPNDLQGGLADKAIQRTSAAESLEEIPPGESSTDVASVFPMLEVTPIDLASALGMVDVQNPQFLLAQSRVLEAVALRQLAAAQYLPTINLGTSYDGHTGNLQQSDGNILSVKRNSLTVGAGVNAIGAGSVNIPGIVWNQNLSLVLFDYLRSRQVVAERQFATASKRNDVGLDVARAYLDLLEAEGRRSIQLDAYVQASELSRLTAAFARAGQGRPADADRARTEQLDREALVVEAEGQAVTVSARLAQLLGIDPSARLHPTDNWVAPHNLVPAPIPLNQLLALSLVQRPELGERRAAIRQAMFALNQSKLLPFSPTVYLGFSMDEFGGGSNLVAQPTGSGPFASNQPRFGAFSGRTDFDAMAYWTLKNIGLGNRTQISAAASRLKQADWQRLGQVEQIRMEVANAYTRAQASLAQVQAGEEAVAAASDSWIEDLTRIRGNEGLPLEAVDSLRLLARARLAYLQAIVQYNRSQFELYVALGQPPADALIRPVVQPSPPEPLPPPAENHQ